MKRIIALVLAMLLALAACEALAAGKSVALDRKNFPDASFRQFMKTNYDLNSDGKLSAAEIKKVDSIELTACNVGSLTGIQHFPNLIWVTAGGNHIKRVDVSSNNRLRKLVLGKNRLTKVTLGAQRYMHYLDVSIDNPELKKLDIGQCPKLLKIFRTGKKTARRNYVLWKVGGNVNANFLKIPQTCSLYSGKVLLYKGK